MNLSIIDKIQKLLRLSGSPNKHEAELALTRAKELALRHELDLAQIQSQKPEESNPIISESVKQLPERECAEKYINAIISKHFRVKIILHWETDFWGNRVRTQSLTFIGKKLDLEIATYVYKFLCLEFNRLLDQYLEESKIKKASSYYADAYFKGLAKGLSDKLTKEEEEILRNSGDTSNWSLMRHSDEDNIQKKIQDMFGDTLKEYHPITGLKNQQATNRGYKDGQKLEINKALENGDSLGNKQLK